MSNSESKQSFAALRDSILSQNGKQYWRSLEEFADTPEFREFVSREYPHEAEHWDNGLSRRNFVKVMGASLALAGLSGCVIQPAENIVPPVHPQEGQLPGKPAFFATAMPLGGVATGLFVKSFDGRPIKAEGNPEHPGSRGATDVLAQASILGMYDPDRSQEIRYRGTDPRSWAAFMTEIRKSLDANRADGGAGIRFLAETVTSPTLVDQFNRLKAELPNAKLVQYEPINSDNVLAGAKLAFGSPAQPVYKFDKAERILTLDADIFSGFNVAYIKDFAKGREIDEEKKTMNRLYAIETTVSLTGAKADHRLTVKPSQMPEIAKAIAKAVGVAAAQSNYTDNAQWIAAMAKDLAEHKGKSLVVAGANQQPIVHALAHAMNDALGNNGQTVTYIEPLAPNSDKTQTEQFREFIADVDAGKVKMLVVLGGNPVYYSPSDLKLDTERMRKCGTTIHLGLYQDETADNCIWHVNEKHYLEMWSDTRAYDGTAAIIQPLIEPLYDGKSIHEIVQLFFKENFEKRDHDIVKEYWQKTNITPTAVAKAEPIAEPKADKAPASAQSESAKKDEAKPALTAPAAVPAVPAATVGRSFEALWKKAVHDGVIPNTAAATRSVSVSTAFLAQAQNTAPSGGPLEISILPDPCVYDGRFSNNGWLQELPNPINKITWENVGLISPNTAKKLGINTGNDAREYTGGTVPTSFVNSRGGNLYADLVKLKYQGSEIKAPVPMWISPGQPDDVITVFMGYGRTRAGKVGTGLGYNVFDVRRSDAADFGTGEVTRTGEITNIASTQTHFNMEGRDLLRVWDLNSLEDEIEAGHQHNEYDKSMYPYEQHTELYDKNTRWAMTIDLNSCVGCNACVIACQSENNIPVVGKEQVERSREMHWLRIDSYYGGSNINEPDGPHFQPLLCQQCEQAPCEVVCPVHATVHSAEGLNDMVYNRCVGTRYCSNNCPYKVRRFNFLLYQDWHTPQYKLMRNPEVSIRSRGVMEKCTFCTQRIAAARIEAQKDGAREIRDGEVQTACQTVCPADAIKFGNAGDATSEVAKAKKDHRNYNLLNELNTQPRTTYLAAVKNFNKEMPDYKPKTFKKNAAAAGEKKPGETSGGH